MNYLIIGDIAGRYNELITLLDQCKADYYIFVGDPNDRGKDSRLVIQKIKQMVDDGIATMVKSNHADMFVSLCNYKYGTNFVCSDYEYEVLMYPRNGMLATINSYKGHINEFIKHAEWLSNLPWYFEDKNNNLFVSHAVWYSNYNLLWNRYDSKRRDLFQIYGHNGKIWVDRDHEGEYALCIDSSHNNKLSAIFWPSKQIISVDYEESNN